MQGENETTISDFFLSGFQNFHSFNIPFFVMILLVYLLTVGGNLLIIMLVATGKNLQSPMYFFLQHLSLCDIFQTTNIAPVMLNSIINKGITMSLAGCFTQFYFFGASETLESLFLTIMSFDRYLAICNPLRYSSIMNHNVCITLILVSWVCSFCLISFTVNAVTGLRFCKQNTIDHFFCDLAPLLDLSCSDTFMVRIKVFLLSIPVIVFPFILVVTSYIYIAITIFKITSSAERHKAFSTCSSHVAVVSIFYGTLTAIYMVPTRGQSLTMSKVLSLLYTVVTPMLNPIIYSLRATDMKIAFKKLLH